MFCGYGEEDEGGGFGDEDAEEDGWWCQSI